MREGTGRWGAVLTGSAGGGWWGCRVPRLRGCYSRASGPQGTGRDVLASGLCQASPRPGMRNQLRHRARAEGLWGACVCLCRAWEAQGGHKLGNPELSALVPWLVNGQQPFSISVFSK